MGSFRRFVQSGGGAHGGALYHARPLGRRSLGRTRGDPASHEHELIMACFTIILDYIWPLWIFGGLVGEPPSVAPPAIRRRCRVLTGQPLVPASECCCRADTHMSSKHKRVWRVGRPGRLAGVLVQAVARTRKRYVLGVAACLRMLVA